ncbi:MAG: HEAT repeat domain-containing protein [Planctomycetes bacterium]|nr:HEAT repeat domain-containing protein [Planctomycetota bacterium]
MRCAHRLLVTTWTAVSLLASAHAHGGQYRGPTDVKPPSGNSGSGGTGGGGAAGSAGGSGAPAPSGGLTGGPATAGAGGTGIGAAPRGVTLDDDLTRWEFWWEFGKDPFLRLRDAVAGDRVPFGAEDPLLNPRFRHLHGAIERPTDGDLQQATETLARALQRASDRDTISACLVALAKIGRDGTAWRLHDVLVPFLARNDQEQRETAALALGIARRGDPATLDLLADLVRDTEAGRRASAQAAVNERTRAFAAYALGLQLQSLRRPAPALRVVGVLRGVVGDATLGWNLRVAAIEALALFPADWHGAAADTLRDTIVDDFRRYFAADVGPGEQLVQAHVPTALARLLGRDDPRAAAWRQRFASELERGLRGEAAPAATGKTNVHIAQSCALALGDLSPPWAAAGDAGEAVALLLLRVHQEHRDQQTRAFAMLSLARLGGPLARDALLRELDDAQTVLELPWIGLALGVWTARSLAPDADGSRRDPDRTVQTALRRSFAAARTPTALGALGLALGLAQAGDGAASVRATLRDQAHRDDLAGYLALALGLMGDVDAIGDIRALMAASARRPQVLQQAVRALGLLGDHTVVPELCRALEHPEPSLVRLSAIASALGQIGDRRSLPRLGAMLEDARLTPLTRAFAAVAIGMVGDKDPLPWNAAYATCTNYRAATETLTDGAAGILDIL